MKNFKEVIEAARKAGPKILSVAVAQDEDVLKAVKAAVDNGIIIPILVGEKNKIIQIAQEIGFSLEGIEIIDVSDLRKATYEAVKLVSSGRAQIFMKGMVDTSVVLGAALDKSIGLRTGKILSHVAVFFLETYHKMLLVTDAAINIEPDLDKKKEILENAVDFAHSLGLANPKCAVICVKETVNPAMRHTVEAAQLVAMNESGEIRGCVVGGPFALDNAISKEAADHKGIKHVVAGDADILLMPQIEAGNVLYKSLTFLANADSAGLVLGASAPIVLTSRADTDVAKLNSIALASLHV
ncbi:MAG: Phosphotransbutyrylase [Clostridiales bacterium 38_11]|nr:MAG: Phosphotransbutyrylase [Clostridiales bacterium 38_11]HBH12887.1 phosphate butyryltransferase [Clostridiales bacterium]